MAFLAQPAQRAIERDQRPPSIEDPLRCVLLTALQDVVALRVFEVEREVDVPSAALGRSGALLLVDDEPLQHGEQEPTKPAACRIRLPDVLPLEQAREEPLREISRCIRIVAAPPQVAVQRRPVDSRTGRPARRAPARPTNDRRH
jgi:hypothetical protein